MYTLKPLGGTKRGNLFGEPTEGKRGEWGKLNFCCQVACSQRYCRDDDGLAKGKKKGEGNEKRDAT